MTTEDRPMADITGGKLLVGEHNAPCPHVRPAYGWQSAKCVKPLGHDTHWNGSGDVWQTDHEAYKADIAEAEERGRQRGRAEAIADLRDNAALSAAALWSYEAGRLADYLEAKGHQP